MREFTFTDEHSVAFAKALAGNRSSKFGLPTEAVLAAKVGGARRNRTDDLLLAKQALSQLSYGPVSSIGSPIEARGYPPRLRPCGLRRAIFTRFASEDWWAWEDLNFRPHAYQARALTN
jgi:hypothetical protein